MGKVTLFFTVLVACVLTAQAQLGGSLGELMLMQALMQGGSSSGSAAAAPAAPAPGASINPAMAASLMRSTSGAGAAPSGSMSPLGRAAALSALTRSSGRSGRGGLNWRRMLMMRQLGMDQMMEMSLCQSMGMPMFYCMTQMA